ncbi:MAG: mechanosensitive ion channel [Desulfuromonadales bacterium]|jgi:small-conductance mechanosensitive channel
MEALLGRIKGGPGWETTLYSLLLIFAAVVAGVVVYWVVFHLLARVAARTESLLDNELVKRWKGPGRLLLPLFFILLVTPALKIPREVLVPLRHLFTLAFISGVAWVLVNSTLGLRDLVLSRYDVSSKDNLKARAVHTQVNVLVRIVLVAICVVAVACLLMTFEKVRQVGVSLLASAGIAGVIAGFAAQHSLGALFAGIQIAITQPIRIDDVVIVEGEWGKIEEIALTYVVVRIWDLRRLVVPVTYFLQTPFQNWTRVSADLLGTVFLYTDYTVPVEAVREELQRLLKKSEFWDGKVWGVQVTNATEHTMELRALMSAADSSTAWNLRCEIREKLIEFLQKNYPGSLPRVRAEMAGGSKNEE